MKKTLGIIIFLLCPLFVFSADKVNINTASLEQLDTIIGIGPITAQKIIDARPFSSLDDLSKIKGIGNGITLQKIKDQGLAYISETSNPSGGTSDVPPTVPTTSTTVAPPPTYPDGVFINEILPSPKGADETDEYIELYNSNNFEVDLSGWQIQDTIGTPKTFTIPKDTKILANGFFIFKRPDTNIMLNNDGDGLNLLMPDKKIIASVTFGKAPLGQSYNKTSGSWAWSTTLTPNRKNIITAVLTKSSSKTLSNAKNSVKNDGVEVGLADISQNPVINQTANPWFLFFMVLTVTIILATIVLLIKIRFRNVTKNLTPRT